HLLDQVWKADLEDAAGDGFERHLKPEFGAFPALFLGALKAPERFRLRGVTGDLRKSRTRSSATNHPKTRREKTMKTQTYTPDPALVKAAAYSCQVFDDMYNNNDPEALANLFTEDAVLVTDNGIFHGRAEILEYQIDIFKDCHFSDHKLQH